MNIGIIGLGAFSEYHIKAALLVDGIQVTAVSRRNKAELDVFCKEHGVKGYTDYLELLDDESIDAVLISTPHHLHTSIVEDAAARGKHILLEKPLAESPEGVARIEKAILDSEIRFMAGFSNHFTKANRIAKEIVSSGEIGEIISGTSVFNKYWMVPERREWHLSRQTGGGIWLTMGIHLIDRLSFFIDSRVCSVSAVMGTRFHKQDAHDCSSAFLRYANGAAGYVSANGYTEGGPIEETVLMGTKGALRINQEQGVMLGKLNKWKLLEGSGSSNDHVLTLAEEWRVFKQYVENGQSEQTVGMGFALHVMDTLFAAERSEREKREIIIPAGER